MATEASRAARACATAASIAPRSTGSPVTPVGTTRGREGQMLATAATETGDPTNAITHLQVALQLKPQWPEARAMLARFPVIPTLEPRTP